MKYVFRSRETGQNLVSTEDIEAATLSVGSKVQLEIDLPDGGLKGFNCTVTDVIPYIGTSQVKRIIYVRVDTKEVEDDA